MGTYSPEFRGEAGNRRIVVIFQRVAQCGTGVVQSGTGCLVLSCEK